MKWHQHSRAAIALVLSVVLAAGCGGDDPSGPATVTGTYSLRTVNGNSVPFTFYDDGTYKFEIIAGSATLNANGTYTSSHTWRETENGQPQEETDVCSGTYVRSGSTITFTESTATNTECGGTFTANFTGGNTLTMTVSEGIFSLTAVYRK